ncbi:LiaF domain-containing protein [Brooklawnia sp.]|uniref:LiaF domain-containing protein n=1 Tax=Brooklawnia sp. TaxID=2699740 RepID=UPI00311E3A9D
MNDEPQFRQPRHAARSIQDVHHADDPALPKPGYQANLPTQYSTNSLSAILSTKNRDGAWMVPPNLSATSVMGTIKLDLREAVFESRDISIDLNSFMGDLKLWVPEGTLVVDETRAFASDVKLKKLSPPQPGGLKITLTGDLILGTVIVYGSNHRSWSKPRRGKN